MYLERFNGVLFDIRDDAVLSLPVLSKGEEILFTYYTVNTDADIVRIGRILNVFTRNILDGIIREETVPKIIKESRIEIYRSYHLSTNEEKLFETRQEYLNLYEKIYLEAKELNGTIDCSLQKSITDLFNCLVSDGPLKEFYYFLGKGFFAT